MHFPSTIFALLAATHLTYSSPIARCADIGSAIGGIIGDAGAATKPAAGDSSNCNILESKCNSHHGSYAEYCVEYCTQCDAANKEYCDAAQAGATDCVGADGTRCY